MKRTLQFYPLVEGKMEIDPYTIQHHSRFEWIIGEIGSLYDRCVNKNEIRILDFGSLNGSLGIALKTIGYDVHCVDLEQAIEPHIGNYRRNDIPVRSLEAAWEILPFDDNYFDCVVFSEVLEHLYESPLRQLGEVRRVLRQDGFLVLTTPNVMRIENKIKFFLNISIYQDIERYCYNPRWTLHFREYTTRELRILLESYLSFRSVRVRLFDYTGGRTEKARLIQRILYWVNNLCPMFKGCILVVAQKR